MRTKAVKNTRYHVTDCSRKHDISVSMSLIE